MKDREPIKIGKEEVFKIEELYSGDISLDEELNILLKDLEKIYAKIDLEECTRNLKIAEHEGDEKKIVELSKLHQKLSKIAYKNNLL